MFILLDVLIHILILLALIYPAGLLESVRRDKSLLYFVLGGLTFLTCFSLLFAYLANIYH